MRKYNSVLTTYPVVKFKPINLMSLQLFYDGLASMYESGNLSRTDYSEAYGYDFLDTQEKRAKEDEIMKELDVEPVAPSNVPGAGGAPGAPVAKKPAAKKPTAKKPAGRPTKAPEAKGKTPAKKG